MTYVYLALAIVFEVAWAIGLKFVLSPEGRIRYGPTSFTLVTYLLSLAMLVIVTQRMNISTAYAIWAGTGAAIIAIIAILYFHEPSSLLRIVSLGLVVAGVVGLNLSERHTPAQPSPTTPHTANP